MPEPQQNNPAEIAAQKALDEMFECIQKRQNFRLEAGAGAGKTYSLVKALKLIINEQGGTLQRSHQQVACITYTNVATDEIISRTDGHPAVHASTIHAFCWDMIKRSRVSSPTLDQRFLRLMSGLKNWKNRAALEHEGSIMISGIDA